MPLRVQLVPPARRKAIPQDASKIGFGRQFSDHLFAMDYQAGSGWHNARIEPYGPLQLDPAAMVLHYGQEVFEGLKAYRGDDDGIYLFRYRDNLQRLNHSCDALVMPRIDVDFVADALRQLLLIEREWVPRGRGASLYIRPNMIAVDPYLGVRPSQSFLFYIILGPVGAYYPEGFNPITIFVSDQYVRAVRGGVGEAKTAANYAASLRGQHEAKAAGYTQVLWLDAIERRYVEEVGTMNIFFLVGGELFTSPLNGTILPGITRESVLQIARSWGVPVREEALSIDQLVDAAKSGTLQEVFGTGTAAVISPVRAFCYRGETHVVGNGDSGALALKLYDYLLRLQYGQAPDPYGWVTRVDG